MAHHVLLVLQAGPVGGKITVCRQEVENTGIPVEQDQQVVYENGAAKDVWVVGVALAAVQKVPKAVDFDQPEAAQRRIEAQREVEKVQGQQTETVHVEERRVHVVLPDLARLRLEDPVVDVAGPEVEGNVQYVQKIGEVIQRHPHLKFPFQIQLPTKFPLRKYQIQVKESVKSHKTQRNMT